MREAVFSGGRWPVKHAVFRIIVCAECESYSYIEIHAIPALQNGDLISTSVSIRLPDDIAKSLADLAETIERPKTYVIRKAIEEYLREYADYLIALERLDDKDDNIISDVEMTELLGIQD
jgi:RHH-type transcriptional regulator, rel operon repressor / antitoxin RelB